MTTSATPVTVPWWKTDLGDPEIEAVTRAIRDRHIHHGPLCRQLEEALAERIDVPYVVAATSGSVALLLAMLACGVEPGDEVVIPALTFIAPAHAVLLRGARVRLVDVGAERPLIDASQLESVLGPRTKAVVAVHLNGRAADVGAVRAAASRVGARVIEDCAQAFQSRGPHGFLGGEGDVAAFSLGLTKLVTTGEGGFVATRDAELYDRMLRLRNHGVLAIANNSFQDFGVNFRLTDMQAAVGLAQLTRLDEKVRGVNRVYEVYRRELASVPWARLLEVRTAAGELPLWSEILCPERDAVRAGMLRRGVESKAFHPCLANSAHLGAGGHFPNAERFARLGLTLPSGPDQTEANLAATVAALRATGDDLGLAQFEVADA